MTPITNRSVAVIMAAYNAERSLPEAVASVLAITLPVDLFVVDDASRVPAEEVLKGAFGVIPLGIVVLRCAKNMGPSRARNLALHHTVEAYRHVAVLDADDLADSERFAKQAAYLEGNPGIAAVGTWRKLVDEVSLAVIALESYSADQVGLLSPGSFYRQLFNQ